MLYGGWELFLYWEKVKNEEDTKQKQDAAAMVHGGPTAGPAVGSSSRRSRRRRRRERAGLRNWLKVHGQSIEDPRKAWIRAGLLRGRRPGRPGGSQARLRAR